MISKEQYIESLIAELKIIKHLAEKIKPEQLSHKPTEAQRTTEELMHYLSYIFIVAVDTIALGDTDAYKKYSQSKKPTLETFAQMIDKQEMKIRELITPMNDEILAEEITMWGRTQSRAMHLFGLIKMAAAYKMQLFLYMKQSGTSNIGTSNLWAGMDQPPKVQ